MNSTIAFWVFLGLLVYHYLAYPATVLLLARLKAADKSVYADSGIDLPRVTLLIAAYNEEKVIGRKITNSLALDYPPEKLEIMVVSDGSNDATSAIIQQFSDRGVVSLHEAARRGKTSALNRGVAAATGDIVLFSDANNDFNAGAVRALVAHFADPAVGGVCGVKRIKNAEGRESTEGDNLYWRYESAIKMAESKLGTITNGDGEIFAVRRSLYQSMDETVINDDAELTLILVKQGFQVRYETAAESYEYASIEIRDDFFVKVRMVAGGFQTIARHVSYLLPPRNWFGIAFFSHKILRWTAPLWLIALFLASIRGASQPLYAAMLSVQIGFYGLAVIGWQLRQRDRLPMVIYVPFYFCAMNLAAFIGLIRFLKRTQGVQWRKAQR